MKFIHLTDTHLVGAGETLYGLDPEDRLARAIRSIDRDHGDAEFAILTGDIADKGDPAAYARLRTLLDGLAIPWHLAAGNHEDREAMHAAFPETPRIEGGFFQYGFDSSAGRMIVLDTLVDGSPAGHLCDTRLDWLTGALDAAATAPVFLFMHHPPVAIGVPALDALALDNPDALAARLSGHSDIRHLFFGHVHRPVHGVWQGIPFSALPSTNHQTAFPGATAPASGILDSHEAPAYGVVRIDPNGDIVINQQAFLDDSPRFFISGPDAVAESVNLPDLPVSSNY